MVKNQINQLELQKFIIIIENTKMEIKAYWKAQTKENLKKQKPQFLPINL